MLCFSEILLCLPPWGSGLEDGVMLQVVGSSETSQDEFAA